MLKPVLVFSIAFSVVCWAFVTFLSAKTHPKYIRLKKTTHPNRNSHYHPVHHGIDKKKTQSECGYMCAFYVRAFLCFVRVQSVPFMTRFCCTYIILKLSFCNCVHHQKHLCIRKFNNRL